MNRRSTCRSARAPTGSAASSRAATSNISASRTGGARICRSSAARTISTPCALNIIATATSASKALPPGTICSARNSPRAPGRRVTISRRQGRPGQARRVARRYAVRRAGLVHQYAAAEIRRSAAARGARQRVRFRMDQQDDHVWRLRAHGLGVSELRHDGEGPAERRGIALLEPFRGQLPDEVFGEPYMPPVSDGSGQDRAQLRKAAQLLKDAGCVITDGKRVLPNGEPHHHRISDRRADVRAASRAVHQEISARSASTPRCASSIRCNTARGATASTSISPSTASAFPPRRAIRCARTSPRRRRR